MYLVQTSPCKLLRSPQTLYRADFHLKDFDQIKDDFVWSVYCCARYMMYQSSQFELSNFGIFFVAAFSYLIALVYCWGCSWIRWRYCCHQTGKRGALEMPAFLTSWLDFLESGVRLCRNLSHLCTLVRSFGSGCLVCLYLVSKLCAQLCAQLCKA